MIRFILADCLISAHAHQADNLIMTNHQSTTLCHSTDREFSAQAIEYGYDVAGPSDRGCFLVRTPDGKAWLFGNLLNTVKHGRLQQESVWSELNLSYFKNTQLAAKS